jgi:uncharacterized protein YutE (UPF0331/DUF86 family)
MDDSDVEKVVTALEHIGESVEVLRGKQGIELEAYLEHRETRDVVERRFETAIQACIDAATVLVRANEQSVPDTNRETVSQLADLGVVSEQTGRELEEAVGFRNVLAHQYGSRIDDEIVHGRLSDLGLFVTFVDEVYDHLRDRGAL